MSMMYLLPCSCGAKVAVEPRQAGELIRCDCGASLAVPAMMKMANLEPAESVAEPPSHPWGTRQSMALVGGMLVVLSLGWGVFLLQSKPKRPDLEVPPEMISQAVQYHSPRESWQAWRYMRAYGLDRTPSYDKEDYEEELFRWQIQMGVVLLAMAGGIALIAIPPLTRRRSRDDQTEDYSRST